MRGDKMEVIKEIKGTNYIISDDGKIYSTSNVGRGKYHQEITQRLDKDGYSVVTLGVKGQRSVCKVHRIIAETFIPNNDITKVEVDHINNIRTDNRVCNLQWVSHLENVQKIPDENKCDVKGESNPNSKLKVNDIKQIRHLYNDKKYSITKLSNLFNVGWTTISHIVNYETWI